MDRGPVTPEMAQRMRWEREMNERNRPLSDAELDMMFPANGYKILDPSAPAPDSDATSSTREAPRAGGAPGGDGRRGLVVLARARERDSRATLLESTAREALGE